MCIYQRARKNKYRLITDSNICKNKHREFLYISVNEDDIIEVGGVQKTEISVEESVHPRSPFSSISLRRSSFSTSVMSASFNLCGLCF